MLIKKTAITVLLLVLAFQFSALASECKDVSQGKNVNNVDIEDSKTIDNLVRLIKIGDKAGISALIAYPLERESPLLPILNKRQFIEHYDEFIDAETTKYILEKSKERCLGDSGMTYIGNIRLQEGLIFNLPATKKQQKIRADLLQIKKQYGKKPKTETSTNPDDELIAKAYNLIVLSRSNCRTFANAKHLIDFAKYDYIIIDKFIKLLKSGDKAGIKKMIPYSLPRLQPLPPADFAKHYDEFLDSETTRLLIQGEDDRCTTEFGTKVAGLMLVREGRIIKLPATEKQERLATKARQKAQQRVHPSAANYDRILMDCKTKSLRIRVQRKNDTLTFFSWKVTQSLKKKPSMILSNGEMREEGHPTSGRYYLFTNDEERYEIFERIICGEDCNHYLRIYKNEEQQFEEKCKLSTAN